MAPVAVYFKNRRRSTDVLSSAIGTLRDQGNSESPPEFPSWHPGWQASYTQPPALGTGVHQNSFIPCIPSLQWTKSYGSSSALAHRKDCRMRSHNRMIRGLTLW